MPAPTTFAELRAAISAGYPGLSKRLQQIAQFALRHPNDLALETIAVIAGRAKVQPSSLIRFAKAFGYDGFSGMQRVFRSRLIERSPGYGERIEALRRTSRAARRGSAAGVLHEFATAAIGALEHLRDETPGAKLERATDLLARAEIVHLLAQRRSFPVAAYLAYAFSHLERPTHLLDGVGGMLNEQARCIRPRDALVAISFRPYAPEVMRVAAEAAERGVPIVGVTDGPLSPLMPLAAVCFEVEEAEVLSFRSLSATMCLALALTVGLGARLRKAKPRRRRAAAARA
ncbi:MAG: MurR/RpiR family transcriptional regulator [Dongiaceae bacterium]